LINRQYIISDSAIINDGDSIVNTGPIDNYGLIQNNTLFFNKDTISNEYRAQINCTQNGSVFLDQKAIIGAGNIITASAPNFVKYFGATADSVSPYCMCYNIETQPANGSFPLNGIAAFTVKVSNDLTGVTYQWFGQKPGFGWAPLDDSPFSGYNSPTLMLNPVTATYNNWQFRCLVMGPQIDNRQYSNAAILTVDSKR
jgi:hypothetical protein